MGPLARALRERERPLILHVPCSWPSCPESVALPFDLIAGPHTEVVTEYTSWGRGVPARRGDAAARQLPGGI